MKTQQIIDNAFEMVRSGKRTEACLLLRSSLDSAPKNEALWLALANISDSQRERISCLEQILQINPRNKEALKQVLQGAGQQTIDLSISSRQPSQHTQRKSGNLTWLIGSLVVFLLVGLTGVGIAWYTLGPGTNHNLSLPNLAAGSGMLLPTNASSPTLPAETAPATITSTLSPSLTPTQTSTNTSAPSQTPTTTMTPTPEDTRTPSASLTPAIPPAAIIEDIEGSKQLLSLSCEANVATIWAQYHGTEIDERTLQSQLPISDNPESGFVGNVNSAWGQIPPKSYGVHPQPIASLLRDYDLNAMAVKNMSWDDLKRSIASGNPVIVWVLGKVWAGQSGVDYYAQDGSKMLVVPYEHTVLVTGYDEEEDIVYILDGLQTYERTTTKFLDSWETLGNLAIIWGP
jgi:uncharacterized protein YvpB